MIDFASEQLYSLTKEQIQTAWINAGYPCHWRKSVGMVFTEEKVLTQEEATTLLEDHDFEGTKLIHWAHRNGRTALIFTN